METMSVYEFIKTVSTPEGLLLALMGIIVKTLIMAPIVRILRRTGYSGWWAIIGLMPPWSLTQLGEICVVGPIGICLCKLGHKTTRKIRAPTTVKVIVD
jgi:hypothetical protein